MRLLLETTTIVRSSHIPIQLKSWQLGSEHMSIYGQKLVA